MGALYRGAEPRSCGAAMMVVVAEHITPVVRGWLAMHLLEVQPLVFVGVVSARVRQHLIADLPRHLANGSGGVTVVWADAGAMQMRTYGHVRYTVCDFDGLPLMVQALSARCDQQGD
jgi:CRISPR-associated endoribonuclease Cas2 subtype I-E